MLAFCSCQEKLQGSKFDGVLRVLRNSELGFHQGRKRWLFCLTLEKDTFVARLLGQNDGLVGCIIGGIIIFGQHF